MIEWKNWDVKWLIFTRVVYLISWQQVKKKSKWRIGRWTSENGTECWHIIFKCVLMSRHLGTTVGVGRHSGLFLTTWIHNYTSNSIWGSPKVKLLHYLWSFGRIQLFFVAVCKNMWSPTRNELQPVDTWIRERAVCFLHCLPDIHQTSCCPCFLLSLSFCPDFLYCLVFLYLPFFFDFVTSWHFPFPQSLIPLFLHFTFES